MPYGMVYGVGMTLCLTILGVEELGNRVWFSELDAEDLKLLGPCVQQTVGRTVVLIEEPVFDSRNRSLRFGRNARVLALGSTSETVFVDCKAKSAEFFLEGKQRRSSDDLNRSPGDSEFLKELSNLSKGVIAAGELILSEVRKYYDGSLERGLQRNFTERPDSFWAIKVQPRDDSLSVTVRGAPTRFSSHAVELKPDRNGYTRFKVRDMRQAHEAVRIVKLAKRKPYRTR